MKMLLTLVGALLIASASVAGEQSAASPSIDPNLQITLTLAELQALIASERAAERAAGVIQKVEQQMKAAHPKK